jgi:hypothetical protein
MEVNWVLLGMLSRLLVPGKNILIIFAHLSYKNKIIKIDYSTEKAFFHDHLRRAAYYIMAMLVWWKRESCFLNGGVDLKEAHVTR